MDDAQPPLPVLPASITLSRRTLLVLCGPAGAGKSTYARAIVTQHQALGLAATSIVSSDYCRALVCDDENNQRVSRDAFDLFYYILHKRMFQGVFTIVDSTALQKDTRRRLVEMAGRHHYATCLLLFHPSVATCVQRDRARIRSVGEQVIQYHEGLMQHVLLSAPLEGWHQYYVLEEQQMDTPVYIVTE